jgi:hypothetical protein
MYRAEDCVYPKLAIIILAFTTPYEIPENQITNLNDGREDRYDIVFLLSIIDRIVDYAEEERFVLGEQTKMEILRIQLNLNVSDVTLMKFIPWLLERDRSFSSWFRDVIVVSFTKYRLSFLSKSCPQGFHETTYT